MVSYYLVIYKYKKRIEDPREFSTLDAARKAAMRMGIPEGEKVYVFRLVDSKSEDKIYGIVENYGDHWVWVKHVHGKGGRLSYPSYPIYKNGSIGREYRY